MIIIAIGRIPFQNNYNFFMLKVIYKLFTHTYVLVKTKKTATARLFTITKRKYIQC